MLENKLKLSTSVYLMQARVIHRNMEDWKQMREAIERVKAVAVAEKNEMGMQTCEELLETFRLSHCMLIMGFCLSCPTLPVSSVCKLDSQEHWVYFKLF
jgi:hypothetical protein